MIKELVPQHIKTDAQKLKSFLQNVYNDPVAKKFITFTLVPFSESQIDQWLFSHVDQGVRYYAYVDESENILGLALERITEEWGYELLGLVVLPEYQQRGIGRALVDFVIDTAKKAGWRCIDVLVFADNKRMLKLMIDKDFIPVRIEFHKRADGADAVWLKRYL